MSVYKDSGIRLPVRMRDGVPVCDHCDTPMVQVEPPTDTFAGGMWQCPIAQAEVNAIAEGIAHIWDRRMP